MPEVEVSQAASDAYLRQQRALWGVQPVKSTNYRTAAIFAAIIVLGVLAITLGFLIFV